MVGAQPTLCQPAKRELCGPHTAAQMASAIPTAARVLMADANQEATPINTAVPSTEAKTTKGVGWGSSATGSIAVRLASRTANAAPAKNPFLAALQEVLTVSLQPS